MTDARRAPMHPESWARLNRLLDEALELSPDDWTRWLAELGPEDEAVKPRVQALLAHLPSVHADSFLGTLPKIDSSETDDEGAADERAGASVGPYRLLRELGEGGMGTVWLAERTDGLIPRPVALKLPRGAWPRLVLVERMARERDILAALTHPNIARLYDAGVTAGGRPYLALEYVDGRPIDEYCRDHRLDVRARVRVFLQVTHAVAYAHAKLVVHRDLKPSNILVTADGDVRLLDFGVAKLLDQGEARHTALTELAGRPHTPEYASPEQLLGAPLGIATDVYSLGVVLYELLTGTRPCTAGRDSRGTLEHAVLRTEPRPPSAATTDVAARRALRGDLDTILLKALKKAPDERYATVNALADDLERCLAGRPVVARPDSAWYRSSTFVRRHKVAVGAAVAFVASLGAFAGFSAWQARVLADQRRVADVERNASEQVVRVLIDLFQTTNPAVRPDGDRMPVGEFLSGAQARSLEQLQSAPAVRARLQHVFGLIHKTRGQYEQARQVLDEALAAQRRLTGPDSREALESLQALGEVAHLLGDNERARTLLEESLARHRAVYGERHERTARVLFALAPVVVKHDLDESGALLHRALEIRLETLPSDHPDIAQTLASLGGYHFRRRDDIRALDTFRQALALFPTPEARRHPVAITILNDSAVVLSRLNRHTEAEARQREAIDLGREVLGSDTLPVSNLVNNLGTTQMALGRHADGERSFRAAHRTHSALLGEGHLRTRNVARNVGRALALQGRYVEALAWMDRASVPPAHDDPALVSGWLGIRAQRAQVLSRLGRTREALTEATAVVASLESMSGPYAAWSLTLARIVLGRLLIEAGRPRDAEPALAAAVAYFGEGVTTDPWGVEASCHLARARLLQASSADERRRLQECLPRYRAWGLAERDVVEALERLEQ